MLVGWVWARPIFWSTSACPLAIYGWLVYAYFLPLSMVILPIFWSIPCPCAGLLPGFIHTYPRALSLPTAGIPCVLHPLVLGLRPVPSLY